MNELRKNLLIICEGESTEPNYFSEIRDYLIDIGSKTNIVIKPFPEKNKKQKNILRKGAKPRNIQNKEIFVVDSPIIEEEYKAQPVRYVREAQFGLLDNSYDEVWAVFDKDGHPEHKRAFELANTIINDKKVNIAFNSIAFEIWILLHFEYTTTTFVKSMCKIEKEELLCGTKKNEHDCKGEKCVSGRIVSEKYLEYVGPKKKFDFKKYHQNVILAIERGVKLFNSYQENVSPIYTYNPYTTTYRLVFNLLNIVEHTYHWFNFNDKQDLKKNSFSLTHNENEIFIKILANQTEMINKDSFFLMNALGEHQDCSIKKLLYKNDEFLIPVLIENFKNINPLFIGYKLTESEFLITEIPMVK